MQTDASRSAAVRAAFSELIDYAGLFPPAQLSMAPAVAEYAAEREGPYAWMLGRFIVPASRAPELVAAISDDRPFGLSVILDSGIDDLSRVAQWQTNEGCVRIEALEVVLEPARFEEFAAARKRAALDHLPAFVEFARDRGWRENMPGIMTTLAAAGLGAKVRCGGLDAKAFPQPAELATFIFTACEARVPFKATAGLHHPVRHVDAATGFTMHGFLNLLAATALARAGASEEGLVASIACEDPARFQFDQGGFRFGDHRIGLDDLDAMRREAFIAYGSCSFSEPTEDLRALNLL